jgi:hypothetical protein
MVFECIRKGFTGNLPVVENAGKSKRLSRENLAQKSTPKEVPMKRVYYIGLNIHKRIIAYCIKTASGKLHGPGKNRSQPTLAEGLGKRVTRALDWSDGSAGFYGLGLRFSK